MIMAWNKMIPESEIKDKVTTKTVEFAEEFGGYLGKDEMVPDIKTGKQRKTKGKLTTNQLRKFFGEVKRQQMQGYDEAQFVLLKPKLAYAVGRDKGATKIKDFYDVMINAIDLVKNEKSFKNFIMVFEAIVAYHKLAEETKAIEGIEM